MAYRGYHWGSLPAFFFPNQDSVSSKEAHQSWGMLCMFFFRMFEDTDTDRDLQWECFYIFDVDLNPNVVPFGILVGADKAR